MTALNSEGLEKAQCATVGCGRPATQRFEAGGVGSDHCDDCAEKIRAARPALLPVDGLEVVMEKICHKEQIGIWANEITSALAMSDFLREEWTFDDSVDLEKEIAAQLLDIIKSAFTHPELDLVEALSQASSVIAGLKSEVSDLRDEWQAEYDARLAANTTRRAAEARANAAEEAESEAKDCFWAIYPKYLEMGGEPVSTEAARTTLAERAKAAVDALTRIAEGNLGDDPWQANYARIKQVASESLSAINGAKS